jgi:lipid II:glycine glycyltransferase (peptidoglycan interpeptide bridge formation enzyme)
MVESVKKTVIDGENTDGENTDGENANGTIEHLPHLSAHFADGDAAWDDFVANHATSQFLQTSAWAALKSRFGWQATRVVLNDNTGRPYAGASLLLRRAAGISVAYIPRGPVVDWSDVTAASATMDAVAQEARRMGASVLLVEPELPDSQEAQKHMVRLGLRRSPNTIQPPSTTVLDISGEEDDVLARMKSKWRYNVRLAERKGVTVRELHAADLPVFNQLMNETAARDGFAVHSADYYAAAFELFTPQWGAFLLAEHEGKPLGALVVLVCGTMAWYVWGASSNHERSRMPNHALQWAAMRWARARGATCYDFWGIPDEIGKLATGVNNGSGAGTAVDAIPIDLEMLPSHDLWGVYRFKQGFGGEVVRHVGTWEMPLRPLGYQLFVAGRSAQRLVSEWKTQRSVGQRGAATRWQAITDASAWNGALSDLPGPHVLQSWEWGKIKAQTGWRAMHQALRDESGKTLAAFQLLDRQLLPFVPVRVGYVPKGPTLDWGNVRAVEATLAQIESAARERHCIFVKIDPDVEEASVEGIRLRNLLRQRGWCFSREQIQFKNTAISDLTPAEDALLESMKSKWRYNIRLAERRGISIREGSADDLQDFYTLYQETSERDHFLIRPFEYYRTTWETFLAAQEDAATPSGGALLLAEHAEEEKPVAGILLFRYGDRAWYFYGASSERRRRDMPNYLLQWAGMRWAQQQGCTLYDWWGAPTDPDDERDSMSGVWQFKQGFGAQLAVHVGAWDYPVYPWLYRLYTEAMPRALATLRRLRGIGPSRAASSPAAQSD